MPPTPPHRVALVTGGAIRVGRAISTALGRAGYAVAVNYLRSAQPANELVSELQSAGGRAVALQADIINPRSVTELVDAVRDELGELDLLVNNAAVFERRALLELDETTWRYHLSLNLEAPFRLTRLVGGRMWERGRGRIVNICGTIGIHPLGDYAAYCVAKSGLDALTRCSAQALAPRVQVNGVAPGAILFPEGTSAAERQEVLARVPAGSAGTPEDVARGVLFYAEAPDYITGTILPVDGGASLSAG